MSIFDEYKGEVKFDSSKKDKKGTFTGGTFTGGSGTGGKDLPHLWWVDMIGSVLTAAGLISIWLNFDAVCLAILNVIYNLLPILGVILIIVVIVVVAALMFRRRRYY